MSHFGLKINKTQSPDKTPYTVYYTHNIPVTERKWIQPYYQIISIDPAQKNFAFRIERRYHNGWIVPIVFNKVAVKSSEETAGILINNTYKVLTSFLDKYKEYYDDCHFIVIERQLPQNYQAVRISQHAISYFSMKLQDRPLLPSIIEIDAKLKGRMLGGPKGSADGDLKRWAVEKARELLTIRQDHFSLSVLDHFRTKQDDLADTVCQVEALFICWGFLPTIIPPSTGPDNNTLHSIKSITLQLTPNIVLSDNSLLTGQNQLSDNSSQSQLIPSSNPKQLKLFLSVDLKQSQTPQINTSQTPQINTSQIPQINTSQIPHASLHSTKMKLQVISFKTITN